uniref:Nucleotide-diphospho-sugar transferase domain-containing protein n=1 Tax=viral metagenome TaxID=1070528 RepID=A0A6C0IB09_9ZZZZ
MNILVLIVVFLLIVIIQYYPEFKLFTLLFTNIPNNFEPVDYKKRKIGIITAENRNEEYIKLHDTSFRQYSQTHDCDYIRTSNCPKEESSTYWCKIHKVKKLLDSGKYDYVMWVDSDTIIVNQQLSIDTFISEFGEPDIIIGNDECMFDFLQYNIICAGVFLIKNSRVGKQFIDDCLNEIKKNENCIINGKEQGIWAGICYEQGVMNLLVKTKYLKNTYLDYEKIFIYNKNIFNTPTDYSKNFIIHLAGAPNNIRAQFFKKFI